MATQYFLSPCKKVTEKVMGCVESSRAWTANCDRKAESFVGSNQLFPGKSVMTVRNTTLAAYHVHTILLNVPTRRRQWLKDN